MNKIEAIQKIKNSEEFNPIDYLEFWSDKDFATVAVAKNNDYYQYLSEELRGDLEVFLMALKSNIKNKDKIIAKSSSEIISHFRKATDPIYKAEVYIEREKIEELRKTNKLITKWCIPTVKSKDMKKLHGLKIRKVIYPNYGNEVIRYYEQGKISMMWLGLWIELNDIIKEGSGGIPIYIEGLTEKEPGVYEIEFSK